MQADLGTAFMKSASRYSGRPFLVSPESMRSYQEVADRSLGFAKALSAQGVGPGDRVAIVLRNHPEYVEAIVLRKRGKSSDGVMLFHISAFTEILEVCQSIFQ